LRAATENAERAGVGRLVSFERTDALQRQAPGGTGWIVCNPPYGVRLGDRAEAQHLLKRFGERLAGEFSGWHVSLLGPTQVERLLGFPLETRLRTTNGGLRVQVLSGTVPARQATRAAARP
jgi:23S rRNA G2445 N2-methylase RlmL